MNFFKGCVYLFILMLINYGECSLFNRLFEDEVRPQQSPTPVVFYHGVGDTAFGSINVFNQFLKQHIKGIYVLSIQMGSDAQQDFMNSYFMNLNDQVEVSCQILKNDPMLVNGYNAIGFSQGGLIIRAIAQRCTEPKMLNLITLGGPQQGVFGLPRCPGDNQTICDLVRRLLNYGAYVEFVQDHLVQAEYWHDPLQENLYKEKSVFLADINNEMTINAKYKSNIMNLRNFVMAKFMNDSIVDPPESELFGFYKPGQDKDIYTLRETELYIEDRLGLKTLDDSGRLHLYRLPGEHMSIDMNWFLNEIVNKFLR